MQFKDFKKILNEKWLGIIGIFFLIFFFILTFYLNKKVTDGDLIFLLSSKRPPSLILENFSAIRTNNKGIITVSFDAKKLNYFEHSKNGEILNPRIFLADFQNRKKIELNSNKASYENIEGNFILKNNVSIKVTESNNTFSFQSDYVLIETNQKKINAKGNVHAKIF